jgi:hypothetical protein
MALLRAHEWIRVRLLWLFDPSTSSGSQEGGNARREIVMEVGGWEGERFLICASFIATPCSVGGNYIKDDGGGRLVATLEGNNSKLHTLRYTKGQR